MAAPSNVTRDCARCGATPSEPCRIGNPLACRPRICETCNGYGEICTMRGPTVEDDEFTPCPDCAGTGEESA